MTRRHPKALPFLFLTEMWERFGFYVVQGMLVLYMTRAFGFSDTKSYTVMGVFSALAYISPMVGGFLADRLLGFKQAIFWGGLFLILGYGLLAFPNQDFQIFYLSLATIIVGNGLFKPNISSLLGALYPPGDTSRDSGFTLFYVGINTGVLLAGLSSGFIKDHFGWHAGFLLASLGLVIGVITFWIGLKAGVMKTPKEVLVQKNQPKWLTSPLLFFYCLIAIFLVSFLLRSSLLGDWLLPTIGVILLFFIFMLAAKQEEDYRKRLYMLNSLILSAIIFWMIFLQMFFSVNLFIDRLVDRTVFGFQIPTTAFYSLEALYVILLGPLLAWSWHSLNQNNRNPSPFLKFISAIAFVGLAFVLLGVATYFYNSAHLINPLWIVLAYFLITVGEMLLSPIGLSAVTMLSPPHLTGMMMGVWFVALGFGGQFAGWLAKLASVPEETKEGLAQLAIYRVAFFEYGFIAFFVVVILFLMHLFLKRILLID